MTYSEHYHLNLVQGSDTVNPLTVDKPNYETIDTTMYNNESAGVGTATEVTTGTVHALTRSKTNQNVFRFRATSNYTVGDTFTLDGDVVTAIMSDGTSLANRCYIIGSDVLCAIVSGQLTFFIPKKYDGDNVMVGTKSVTEKFNDVEGDVTTLENKVGGMGLHKFYTITPSTNETWGSILERVRDTAFAELGGVTNFCEVNTNLEGNNGMIFHPVRIYSNATLTSWFSMRSSSSGLVIYSMNTSPNGTRLSKYSWNSSGQLTITDMTDETASTLTVNGPDFN